MAKFKLIVTAVLIFIFHNKSNALLMTGSLKLRETHRLVRARLAWLAHETVKVEQSPFTSNGYVFLTLQRGDSGSAEYFTLNYEFKKEDMDLETGTAHVYRDMLKIFGNQPEIFITKIGSGHWTGTVDSLISDSFGTLDLKIQEYQNKMPAGELLQPIGGYYEADCPSVDQSGIWLTGMEIYPTHLSVFPIINEETLFGYPHLIGGLACRRSTSHPLDDVSCGSITNGQYDFINETVQFRQGSWQWNCKRPSAKVLICSSPRYNNCKFSKKDIVWPTLMPDKNKNHNLTDEFPSTLSYDNKSHAPPLYENEWTDLGRSSNTANPCSLWDYDELGILKHVAIPQYHRIQIRMRARPSNHDGILMCTVTAIAKFFFGERKENSLINTFMSVEANPNGGRILLRPKQEYGDLFMEVVSSPNDFKAEFYSKGFGLIGSFAHINSVELSDLTGTQILGPGGIYRIHDVTQKPGTPQVPSPINAQLTLQVANGASNAFSLGPFGGEVITGFLEQLIQFGMIILPNRDSVGATSYDYFTNSLLLRMPGYFFTGKIVNNGLIFRKVVEEYLKPVHRPTRFMGFKRQIPAQPNPEE